MKTQDLVVGKLYVFDMEGYSIGGHKIVEGMAGWSGTQHERYHGKIAMYLHPKANPRDEHGFWDPAGLWLFLFEDKIITLGEASIKYNLLPAI